LLLTNRDAINEQRHLLSYKSSNDIDGRTANITHNLKMENYWRKLGNRSTYSGYGLTTLNRLQSNLSGCHSTVSRVNFPNIFIEAALARLSSF